MSKTATYSQLCSCGRSTRCAERDCPLVFDRPAHLLPLEEWEVGFLTGTLVAISAAGRDKPPHAGDELAAIIQAKLSRLCRQIVEARAARNVP